MEEQKLEYPCRTVWKATVECPVCKKSTQLRNLTYAHRTRCSGPLDNNMSKAKEDALTSFTKSFEPRVDQKPVHQPAPKDYNYLLGHLLS